MAMNEDSVVSSLNELRRMAGDRARRETAARGRVDEHHRHGGGRPSIRPTEIRGAAGYPDASYSPAAHAPTMMGGMAAAEPQLPQQNPNYSYSQYASQAAALAEPYVSTPPPRSVAGPVLLTILILGGAAGGAYWKLQQDWAATLQARDAAIISAEDARNKAVEMAARTEQLYKTQLASCEGRAKSVTTPATTTATAAPTATVAPAATAAALTPPPAATKSAAPAPAAKPAKMSRAEKLAAKRAARHARRAALVARPAPAPAPVAAPPIEEKKPQAMPKIAGKKKISDDPLAGLKL